jgi:ABC-type transporter Mla subunit MlaD
MADVLHEVPSDDLNTLVHELATGVAGRAQDLANLSEAGADLPERLLEIQVELEALIRTGPEVTGVLADNADVLADDITQTAELADILRDSRFDLVDLSRNGSRFLVVANDILAGDKANIACFVSDSADINEAMAKGRDDLAELLDTNHYFFDAVELAVQKSIDNANWFRVQMLPHQEPSGRTYEPHRDPPDVFPGAACQSRYGAGVNASTGRTKLAPESRLFRP